MHWGLTTFEKKRIERIALDHPYFDTHAPLLTKREIAAIVKEGSHKSGYQVIAEVMAELGITYVPAKRKKRSFREALRDMSFVPSFRRSVALGLLCLLLIFQAIWPSSEQLSCTPPLSLRSLSGASTEAL